MPRRHWHSGVLNFNCKVDMQTGMPDNEGNLAFSDLGQAIQLSTGFQPTSSVHMSIVRLPTESAVNRFPQNHRSGRLCRHDPGQTGRNDLICDWYTIPR